jgi:glycosyltransferase involved in cell wall biosynthesis
MTLLFLTYQGDLAGSTQSIAFLADGLARRGHHVFVGARRESLLASLLGPSPVRVVPMTFAGRFDLGNMRQIRDAVKTHQIDLINAQSSLDRYTSILARWIYRLPVALVHTRRQVSHSSGGWLQQRFYARGTDAIVAVSEGVRRSLTAQGLDPSRIVVIPNGIPADKCRRSIAPERLTQLRERYAIGPRDTVIGCVSRKKRQAQLLQALRDVAEPTTVLFVGIEPGDVDRSLLEPIQGTHAVVCCGRLSPEDALDHFGLLTLHVLPSTTEGLSQSILEAMACGVPVIATRAAGNIDVIQDGENGYLFEDADPQGLARVIRRALTHPEERARIVENARRTATETYPLERTVAAHEQLFRHLVGREST